MDCPSCYEYFDAEDRIPRNLNCGHTFCEQCLIKIEQQRLTVCPICRATIAKPFKPKKLPKNFIALDYAQRQQEMLKKSNFCTFHPKELMKHFCNTCMKLICVDCIVDHSGHSFVRKEESVYVLKENGQNIIRQLEKYSGKTEKFIENGYSLFNSMKMRRIKDIKQIDQKFETLTDKIQAHRALIKLKYNDCFKMEEQRINQELENFEKHMSLINFNKETVSKIVEELESGQSNKISGGSEVANKIENFKKIQDELEEQTQRLQEVQISYPQVQVSMDGFEIIDKEVEQLVSIFHNKYLMSDKRIAFFGDTNKVMYLDLKKGEWTIKTINNNSNSQRGIGSNSGNSQNLDFMYYAAAVTLPNGDALITGGGSSTTVYQYINAKCEIQMLHTMNQCRKEHASVINGSFVYVMGGYDGIQNIFLNCCEMYNIHKNEWKYFAPMNISKCAFSATVVNKEYIYTFGGYDGQQRLDAIERYHFKDGSWELLNVKLKFPLSNCACFCPKKDKVIVFGGGFSSGFSPFVEQIDVVTQQWESLPIMSEGRDLRNKVCYIEGQAYAMGGLNSKAEKLTYADKKWMEVPCYPLSDNLDSWASCLLFTPKLFQNKQTTNQEGLQILNAGATFPTNSSVQSSKLPSNLPKDQLIEQENALNKEIQKEIEKAGEYNSLKLNEFENQMQLYDNESSDPLSGAAQISQQFSNIQGHIQQDQHQFNQNQEMQYFDNIIANQYNYQDISEEVAGGSQINSSSPPPRRIEGIPGSIGQNQRAGVVRNQAPINQDSNIAISQDGQRANRRSNFGGATNNMQSQQQRYLQGNNNQPSIGIAGAVSPNRGSSQQNINLAALGEHINNFSGTMAERHDGISMHEEQHEESAREAAQVIEELQRAQADTLTDDEFDEQSQNPSQIGVRDRESQNFSQQQRSPPPRQNGFPGSSNRSINNRNQVPVPSSGGSGTSNPIHNSRTMQSQQRNAALFGGSGNSASGSSNLGGRHANGVGVVGGVSSMNQGGNRSSMPGSTGARVGSTGAAASNSGTNNQSSASRASQNPQQQNHQMNPGQANSNNYQQY